ncbi:MAG: HNH endonuclease [Paludibacteraceae bacterium]|nr:HNH endonuclease [Paludibacteraceae bacterium]
MLQKQFYFNNVLVRHVPFHGLDVHPVTGIAFYVNNGEGGVIGVQVYPNGRMKQINATGTKYGHAYAHGKQEYLQFRQAWGYDIQILASHAVYIAWVRSMQAGMTIDHINGCTTDNRFENLRQVSIEINQRDGGFLNKLKHKGYDTMRIDRTYLLRYFDRMAKIKSTITPRKYQCLTKQQLHDILYGEEISFTN